MEFVQFDKVKPGERAKFRAAWSFEPEPGNDALKVTRNKTVKVIPVESHKEYIYYLERNKIFAQNGAAGLADYIRASLITHKEEPAAWAILEHAFERGMTVKRSKNVCF